MMARSKLRIFARCRLIRMNEALANRGGSFALVVRGWRKALRVVLDGAPGVLQPTVVNTCGVDAMRAAIAA